MANASNLKQTTAQRLLMLGYPGSGKTGALCCLANAGFKLRILCFDKPANMAPLFQYCTAEGLQNIDIVYFDDPMALGGNNQLMPVGQPKAFANALKLMNHWGYEEDGQKVDLGVPGKDWGLDTIVVLDSLTALGDASLRRARNVHNKTLLNTTDATWGFAMSDQEAFVEKLCSGENKFHLIVMSHLKMVGPRAPRKGDDTLTEKIKEEVGELVSTRLYPSALGWALPQHFSRHFPCTLMVEQEVKGSKVSRVIRWQPRPDVDLKLAVSAKFAEANSKGLPIEDGLLTIFRALGVGVPGASAH